jgi:hypothetical protein
MIPKLQGTQFTGGIHYGDSYYSAFNATWPFARLIVSTGSVDLNTSFFKSFSFPKSQITTISKYGGFFSKGLQIQHSISEYPPFIVFWTPKWEAVKLALIENGYQVSEK